jgi:hypothetical protein
MIFPILVLGFVTAILIGSLVFLIHPTGSFRRLGLFLLASIVGFFLGHITCELVTFRLWMIGAVNMSGGLLGSLLALGSLQVFSLREWK